MAYATHNAGPVGKARGINLFGWRNDLCKRGEHREDSLIFFTDNRNSRGRPPHRTSTLCTNLERGSLQDKVSDLGPRIRPTHLPLLRITRVAHSGTLILSLCCVALCTNSLSSMQMTINNALNWFQMHARDLRGNLDKNRKVIPSKSKHLQCSPQNNQHTHTDVHVRNGTSVTLALTISTKQS